MPSLVTGGAGFVGSHLVDALLAEGDSVRILDNLDPLAHPTGAPPAHLNAEAELLVGDLRDREAVDVALEGVDRVYHLGGIVGNGESMVNVRKAVDANCGGTATLLEAVLARRDRVQRVVAASSMVVYGEGAYTCPEHGLIAPPPRPLARLRLREWEPICHLCGGSIRPVQTPEATPLRPTTVYGITKRDQEELTLVLGRAYGLETVALRFLNVYGSRQELGNPYIGVAGILASRLLADRQPLVYEDGGQLRDFVHVSDAVRALVAAMGAPGADGHAINVATGVPLSVSELAQRVAGALGSELEMGASGEFRAGDVRHCFGDPGLARELLGFETRWTVDDMLPELTGWVKAQSVDERGDEAVADLRARGLVG
jgi:dTDP-L-rhamnose 4-epimerase